MLIRHSSVYLIGRLLSAFITIGSLWLFSRIFAPDVFGVYTSVVAYSSVAQLALYQWLRVTLLRFVATHPEAAALRGNVMALFVGMTALLMAGGLILHFALPDLRVFIWPTLLATFCTAWSELCLDYQRAHLKPRTYVLISLGRDALFLALAWGLAEAGYGVWALLAAFIFANLLPTLPVLPAYLKGLWPLKLRGDLLKSIFKYGLPLAPTFTLSALVNNIDRLLLPILISTHAAGLYGPAHSMARQTINMLMQSVNLAAFPLAIRALETGVDEARKQLRHNLTLLLAIGLPALVGLAALAPAIAHTLFGPDYAPAAAHLLPWLALSWFLHSLRSFYTEQAFQLGKNTRPALYVALASATIAVSTSFYCLWAFGFEGAAYGAVTGASLALLCSWYFGRNIFPLPFPLRAVGKVGVSALVMGAVVWPQRENTGFIWLGLAVASGGLTYVAMCVGLNVLDIRTHLTKRLLKRNPR